MNLKKIIAICTVYMRYYLNPRFRKIVKMIIKDIFDESSKHVSHNKEFIMTCGFSKSGKTTFVSQYPGNEHSFSIVSDTIHDYLNERIDFLRDDNTVHGHAYWHRQTLTSLIRQQLLKMALARGLFIINDSVNLRAKDRRKRLGLAKQYGYTTHIVWVRCPETILLERIKKADSNAKDIWHDLYHNIQSKMMQAPNPHECDIFRIYDSEKNCFVMT